MRIEAALCNLMGDKRRRELESSWPNFPIAIAARTASDRRRPACAIGKVVRMGIGRPCAQA
ncbi:MAG TPA: hypothetical protein VGG64_23265 [Pirellulales bacterium]